MLGKENKIKLLHLVFPKIHLILTEGTTELLVATFEKDNQSGRLVVSGDWRRKPELFSQAQLQLHKH